MDTAVSVSLQLCHLRQMSFLNVVDKDGSFKPPCSQDRCRGDGLAHLTKPDHFFRNDVVNGSS